MRRRLDPLAVIAFMIVVVLLCGYCSGWYSGAQHYGFGITAIGLVVFVLLGGTMRQP
jgi:hypothetical protein